MIELSKPVIEDVVLTEEKQEELDKILDSKLSHNMKHRAIKEIAGGYCLVCGTIASKVIKYKLEDITRIEHYCDKDFKKWQSRNRNY